MTYLSKITEDAPFEDRAESGKKTHAPGGRWSVLMDGWLNGPTRLSSGDVVALAELLRRQEAARRWRAAEKSAA